MRVDLAEETKNSSYLRVGLVLISLGSIYK
uniref:Uncharacterized protein n=1 Tax=Arundo donax TaxID=35708 RepID=A0A0A9HLP2_ARUDO